MLVTFLIHEATALWDVGYATTARTVTPIEQHVRSFLEMIPMIAIVCVVSIHWSQFSALFGVGEEMPRFDLNWKPEPLPSAYIVAVLSIILLFESCPMSRSCCAVCARMPVSLFRPRPVPRKQDGQRCVDEQHR